MNIILSGNPISTNSIYRRHGNIIYMSKSGKDLKTSYQWEAKSQWKKPVTECNDIRVDIALYFKDNRIRDIDNYCKILLDSLTGIVWKDDKQIQSMRVSKYIDKNNPRIEIYIICGEKEHNKKTPLTKCPKCKSRKFVISVFGSICGDCFYEE